MCREATERRCRYFYYGFFAKFDYDRFLRRFKQRFPDYELWRMSPKCRHSPEACNLSKAAGASCAEVLEMHSSAHSCDTIYPWEDVYDEYVHNEHNYDEMMGYDDLEDYYDLMSPFSGEKDTWDDAGSCGYWEWFADDFGFNEHSGVPPQLCADEDVWDDEGSCENKHWLENDHLSGEFDAEEDQRSTKAFYGCLEMIATAPVSIAFAHYFANLQFLRQFEMPKYNPRRFQRLQLTTPELSYVFIASWSGFPHFCRPSFGCQPGLLSHLVAKFAAWSAGSNDWAMNTQMRLLILNRAFDSHRRLSILVKVRFVLCFGKCKKHVRMCIYA
jgi:hypothetical protein